MTEETKTKDTNLLLKIEFCSALTQNNVILNVFIELYRGVQVLSMKILKEIPQTIRCEIEYRQSLFPISGNFI